MTARIAELPAPERLAPHHELDALASLDDCGILAQMGLCRGSVQSAGELLVSALSKYGLLEEAGDKELKVSDLADQFPFAPECRKFLANSLLAGNFG